MSQEETSGQETQRPDATGVETLGPVGESVGYVLKQAASTLRTVMDAALRPRDLTVSQYVCLEVLDQQPGLSGAELARAAFVSRQSMNLVVQGLQNRGLLGRPAVATHGRALPIELTDAGLALLREASAAVLAVERQMLSAFGPGQRQRLRDDLAACTSALEAPPQR